MSRPPKDIAGQKFNRLTAIEFVGYSNEYSKKSSLWRFVCDCGSEIIARKSDVMRGGKTSCGCALKNCGHALPPGEAAFNDLFRRYQKSANRRDKVFELDENEFRTLTSSNCTYCGAPPSQVSAPVYNRRGKSYKLNGEYHYNGIDRVNNLEGYIPSNCVPCCDVCNRAKLCLSPEQFLDWVARVYKHSHLN